MKSYSPDCAVWINGSPLKPTADERENYYVKVASIMEREKTRQTQQVEEHDKEPQAEVLAEVAAPSMLMDPTMFESDVDL